MADLGAEITSESKQTPEGLRTWLQSEINKWDSARPFCPRKHSTSIDLILFVLNY